MPTEKIKLKCTREALVGGEVVKAGKVDSYPRKQALDLLSSRRFEKVDDAPAPAKKTTAKKTAAGGDSDK